MPVKIMQLHETTGADAWDAYVTRHPDASVYHLSAFGKTIESTYGHTAYYLAVIADSDITGVLPLFHIKSIFLGNALISLPFCDYGGICADSQSVASELETHAAALADTLKCSYVELRQTSEIPILNAGISGGRSSTVSKEKVRMVLPLPASAEELFNGFPAKLRSQIRKPQKEGCTCRCGGVELLNDFYTVFSWNMRDLGSPVHSKKLMFNMLSEYGEKARLFLIYHASKPVACSFVAGFRDTLVNPWASFNRQYGKIAPNMLLYWEMLSFAIQAGYKRFDFGRSTLNEGTYRFKTQWGAVPEQLYWYRIGVPEHIAQGDVSEGRKGLFIKVWQKLPLPLTRIAGPVLRKQLHM